MWCNVIKVTWRSAWLFFRRNMISGEGWKVPLCPYNAELLVITVQFIVLHFFSSASQFFLLNKVTLFYSVLFHNSASFVCAKLDSAKTSCSAAGSFVRRFRSDWWWCGGRGRDDAHTKGGGGWVGRGGLLLNKCSVAADSSADKSAAWEQNEKAQGARTWYLRRDSRKWRAAPTILSRTVFLPLDSFGFLLFCVCP